MKIKDLFKENDPEIVIIIRGNNPGDDCDPWAPSYYEGVLKNVPDFLFECNILSVGTSLAHGCPAISVPYLMNNKDYDPNYLTFRERKAGITLEDKHREIKAFYEIHSSCDEIAAELKGMI